MTSSGKAGEAEPQRAAHIRLRQALEDYERNLLTERDHLGSTVE